MKAYILTMNAYNDKNNVSRLLMPNAYSTLKKAREKLQEFYTLHEPKEGYVLQVFTNDVLKYKVRAIPDNYTLTIAIETLEII